MQHSVQNEETTRTFLLIMIVINVLDNIQNVTRTILRLRKQFPC